MGLCSEKKNLEILPRWIPVTRGHFERTKASPWRRDVLLGVVVGPDGGLDLWGKLPMGE